ncbi:MAG TPA: sigma-70 family RNA polymerase sigma factor [Pyrinomonadaceae bacterium]|nr:sigma-70 family RNA polymerase sigma factor [Pyrinomonadaceae bacterium]
MISPLQNPRKIAFNNVTRKLKPIRVMGNESFLLYTGSECDKDGFEGRRRRLSAQPTDNVTRLLIELSNGDHAAVDLLLPVIYDELRKLAANYLRRERPDHTLQPTALVHEAYLRLVDQTRVNWQNRAHFFGVAAQIMRRLLVDHARKHNAEKRGQDFQKLSLDENIDRAVERSSELIALDDALKALADFDEQKARMVELRYFGGLSIEETADVMGVTPTTIKRHWRFAKAWLHGEMQKSS